MNLRGDFLNKFRDKIKDLFYDSTDFTIILLVILIVSGIIAWRLDLLFDKHIDKEVVAPTQTVEESVKDSDKPSVDFIEKEKLKQKGTIEVSIPEGTSVDQIAITLQEKGVVANKFEFLKRAEEMGATSKITHGDYKFTKEMSLEDVIKKLSKQ